MKRMLLLLGVYGLLVAFRAGAVTPSILSEPQSVTVNNASAATFAVVATNAATYQWCFQGTNILAGATNATLSLDDVSTNQAGSYTVIVTSSDDNSVTSAPPALLTLTNGTIIRWTISTYPNGSSNSFLVQLFDHDKPATVENFIHYIISGSYSNTFFDRDVTNFVLQGGDYVTLDRTTNGQDVYDVTLGTNFPSQVDNEFSVGPLIHNRFGTLAMAQLLGETNSATSAFFFNLADNSTNLDGQDFTVFGRILSGTNVLQYFNTLSAPSNGIYTNISAVTNLPVNYNGTNAPTDANFFYCDFAFISPAIPPVDTTPPTVFIAFPTPYAVFTNGGDLTAQGTAHDNVGLAEVFCILTAFTGVNEGESQTNAAIGTSEWSLDLGTNQPGVYQLTAYAQDGAGNLSAPATEYFTNLVELTIITNVDGELTTNAPQYLLPGQPYTVTAAPQNGEVFDNWQSQGVASLDPLQTFTAETNLTLEVTYLRTNLAERLTITSPAPGKQALSIQSLLTVSGTITSTNVAQLTCQFFIDSNSVSAAQPATIIGTNWSLTVTNFVNGNYTVVALATNSGGGSSFVSANFTLLNVERLTLDILGSGTIVSNPGPYVVPGTYTFKAVPKPGQAFYSWNDGVTATLNPSKKVDIVSNLTLTATFVPEAASLRGITFTYPAGNAMLTNGTFSLEGKLPTSLTVTQMTCQLFLRSNSVTALPQPVAIDSTAEKWSFPVTNLAPGPYTVLAVGCDDAGNARLVSVNFNLLAKFTVVVQPSNAGTATFGLNGKYLEVNKSYTISATPKAGQIFAYWTGAVANSNSAVTSVLLSSNTVLTANFTSNHFPAVAGTYAGVFLSPTNVSPTSAGFVTVTTTETGAFTGRLIFPSHTYPFAWQFSYTGSLELLGEGFDSNILELDLNLDLTNGTDTITGFVADQPFSSPAIWSNSLILYRSVTRLSASNTPAAGKYVLLLQPDNATDVPVASGYAAVSLEANGTTVMSGALPDNTALYESANMSKNGIWPVYVVPPSYKGKGMIIGWQTNTPSASCDGQLFWFKPSLGFATNLNSTGAEFAAPKADTQYQMVLAGATNTLNVSQARQFVPRAPITTISLLPTGLLSGYTDVEHGELLFKGAFISPSAGGAGFILDTDGQTVGFQIPPQP
jgi:cyclophilin family peptidyl-prolyl cis-trans isomerase